MIPSSNFRPWRRDYAWGIGMLLASLATSWIALLAGHPYIAVGLAVWPTYRGCLRIGLGASRERGVEIELAAVDRMRAFLQPKGYEIYADIMAIRIGNIDSIVSPPWTQARYVVEIKSFPGIIRRFYGLTKLNKYFRLRQPIRQVWSQCRYLSESWHFPVLWMPESRLGTYFVYRGILVVNGGVDLLEYAMREFDQVVRLPATVTFPYKPPQEYRNYVKGLRFRYDERSRKWYGRISKRLADDVARRLTSANGTIAFHIREGD